MKPSIIGRFFVHILIGEIVMRKNKIESIIGLALLILSVFMFINKRGGLGFFVFLIGLGLYIYSRRGTDYKSM